MAAVWMRVRTEMRARWRAWLALALAFGIAGGAATAAVAGARRTESAYPRFVEEHDGYHVVTGGISVDDPEEAAEIRRALATLPQVDVASEGQFVTTTFRLPSGVEISFPEGLVLGDAAGVELFTLSRAKVLEGRLFDPTEPDEAVVDLIAAERFGIDVDDRVEVMLFDPETFEANVSRPVEVVGIVVAPGMLPAVGSTLLTGVQVSPAFMRAYAENIPPNEDGPVVRVKGGFDQIPGYITAARAIHRQLDFPNVMPRHLDGVRKTLRFDVGAQWVLAILLGLSALVILGQALSRHILLEAGTHDSLRAVGMGRAQMISVDLVRAAMLGGLGAVVAVCAAALASPLFPRGLARVVEPAPGFQLDWTVLGIGAAGTLIVPCIVSLVPSIRAARRRVEPSARPSRIAAALLRGGAGPSVVAGTRLALEPGRGSRAVPVRATIGGIALALAAFGAAGSFGESLEELIASPELYGFGWDVFAGGVDAEGDAAFLADDPDVEAFTRGGYGNISIGGRSFLPLVYEPGGIGPTILEGRAPRSDDEIALGAALMRSLDVSIGDTVMVLPEEQALEREPVPFTVVGRPVVPSVFFQEVPPGESTALTLGGLSRLDPSEAEDTSGIPHLIKYRPGVDIRAKIEELRAARPEIFVAQVRSERAELAALSRSSGVPVLLTGVLLAMAVGTLVHTLGSSIRKRRGDLAVLKTLGFVRRQVRATVAWQASTLVALALVVAVPAGIASGQWSWRWFANTLGVVPRPVSPLLILVVVVPLATVALANLIAAFPARAAARTQPAVVLRSE